MGGIATFLERDIERWLENTQPSELMNQGREFAREWRNVDAKETEYFFVDYSGFPLNEQTVVLVGDELEFTLRTGDASDFLSDYEFEYSGNGGLSINQTGPSLLVSTQQPGDYVMVFTSGHYQKKYEISVLAQRHPEELEALDNWFLKLERSSEIGSESFTECLRLEETLGVSGSVPSQLIKGLVEYHMGLRHEQDLVPEFGDRYERAAVLLYPFAAYSRLASFVVHYFAYRTNSWRLFGEVTYFPNLFAASRFFSSEYTNRLHTRSGGKGNAHYRRPLLINEADDCLIASVRAFNSGDYDKASELCQKSVTAANDLTPDPQRTARLELMQARLARQFENADKATGHYLNLIMHSNALWAEEAKHFIKEHE